MSKAEDRAKRAAQKQEKFEAAKARLVARVVADDAPKTAYEPKLASTPRLAPNVEREAALAVQTPKVVSRFPSRVTWCITRSDTEGEWQAWSDPRAWTDDEWTKIIAPKFLEFQQMTWAYVDTFSSDTGHKMHHSQALWELHKEAQERWLELGHEEFADSIFRSRLGNKQRAWGYVVQAHFHMVWWERQHKIYVNKA